MSKSDQEVSGGGKERSHHLVVGCLLVIFFAVIFALAKGLNQNPNATESVLIGTKAHEFNIVSLQDPEKLAKEQMLSLGAYTGRPLVVNFWASWCLSCRQEAKELQSFWLKIRGSDVGLLGIAIQDQEAAARRFADFYGKTYPLGLDDGGLAAIDYGVVGVPETFFIDRSGVIRFKHTGPIDAKTLERYTAQLR